MLRAVVLAGFAYYIAFLSKSGNLSLYIAPKMLPLVKGAAVVLFAVAVYQVFLFLQKVLGGKTAGHDEACGCGHDHGQPKTGLGTFGFYAIFMLPLLFGFMTPDKVMGSSMIEKKGIQLSASSTMGAGAGGAELPKAVPLEQPQPPSEKGLASEGGKKTEDLDTLFATDEYNADFAVLGKHMYKQDVIKVRDDIFMEMMTALDLFKEAFQGRQIELTGLVYRPEDLQNDQLVLSRFAMSCCSADASPYGVMIQYPRAEVYQKDEWLTLTGTIDKTVYNGNEIIQIKATKIERIDPLESPYVYPNFDFLKGIK
nr:TIGR03943 family protein [Paenibacillus turpanensis]